MKSQVYPAFDGCFRYSLVWLRCLFWLMVCPVVAQAQNTRVTISSGTTLTVQGNNLVLQNTDLQCNGVLNASNATLLIAGANNSFIGGSGSKTVQNFTLNTSAATTLSLLAPLSISNALNFQNGLIDLTNQPITLTGTGALVGESESSYTLSNSTGSVTATRTGVTNPLLLNAGNLGAAITSTASLGNLTVTRFNNPAVNPGNNTLQGIQRRFLIQPQNNAALNATLRFYYLDAELNGNSATTLDLWKSNDGITWVNMGADTRNAAGKYVEKESLADFSLWTLSGSLNPLPLTLLSFKVSCDKGFALVEWKTGSENSLDHFEVERSDNGTDWKKLEQVKATNNTNGSAYTIKDSDPKSIAFYRLKIYEWAGTFTYSPIFRGGCSELPFPFTVYPNPVTDQAIARISVRQPVTGTIQVFNMNGQMVFSNSWQLQPGLNMFPLHLARLNAGRYIVKLKLPDATQEAHLIKQ